MLPACLVARATPVSNNGRLVILDSAVRAMQNLSRLSQVRQFERYIEVTSIVKSSVFNGLYDLEVLIHEIFVITHMDHKAIDTR